MKILIIEDELAIAEPLLYVLQREGFEVDHVTLGHVGIKRHVDTRFDLVVLDIGLPDVSGFDVLRMFRSGSVASNVPIIFLTARGDEIDRVLGLELGADDYVVKPFSPREVVARIRSILRRGAALGACEIPITSVWQHDFSGMCIRYKGAVLELTRYEYRLLALLISKPGRVYSRDDIMARVWEDSPESSDRTIDAHIKTLRAKLRSAGAAENLIRTTRGVGYSVGGA